MDVVAGDEALLQPLSPEAAAIAQLISQISSAPTPEMLASGRQQAEQAFAPLMEQANTPGQAPAATSPLGQSLTLLTSNIAGTVRPEFGAAGKNALNEQREEQSAFQGREADRSKMGLQLAMKMTEQGLKIAADAGDDKAVSQKAIQLARLRDTLQRGAAKERIAQTGEEQRKNIRLTAGERVKAGVDLKTRLNKLVEDSDLSTAGKIRLKSHTSFLVTFLDNATRIDPNTGEPPIPLNVALSQAQQQFDAFLTEQLQKEGKLPKEEAAPAVPGGEDFFSRVKARLDARKKAK